jgi:hypothetical protein
MAPIDYPLGTFRNGRWAGYRLTTGAAYLILPHGLDQRLNRTRQAVYWRFMARQLKRVGLTFTPRTAWRAFAD